MLLPISKLRVAGDGAASLSLSIFRLKFCAATLPAMQ